MGLLSESELYNIGSNIKAINKGLSDYLNSITKILDSYTNDATVKTLFDSGKFGNEQYNDLLLIKNSLNSFVTTARNQLIPTTENYIANQLRLVQGNKE